MTEAHEITINRVHLHRVLGLAGLREIRLEPTTARLSFKATVGGQRGLAAIMEPLLDQGIDILGATPGVQRPELALSDFDITEHMGGLPPAPAHAALAAAQARDEALTKLLTRLEAALDPSPRPVKTRDIAEGAAALKAALGDLRLVEGDTLHEANLRDLARIVLRAAKGLPLEDPEPDGSVNVGEPTVSVKRPGDPQ